MNHSASVTLKYVLLKMLLVVAISILLSVLSVFTSFSQDYQTASKKFHRAYYHKQIMLQSNACGLLEKKRNKKVRQPLISIKHKPAHRSYAEVDQSTVVARATAVKTMPKPIVKEDPKPVLPVAATPKIDHISAQELVALHKREDEVLAENNLPKPTSQAQVAVRKKVSDKLASKTNVYPLVLDPLFFNFAEDEFSVVDMEPFMIAAEYAIQGRTVLIEGHTDNKGKDDYNVNLSIKRVQKIRQLMLDMGVPDERISLVGYGEELGAHTNKTDDGRQHNRRVDFTVF